MAVTEGSDALLVQKQLQAGIAWQTVGAAGAAAFNTGWSNQGGLFQPAQYGLAPDGTVHLRGLVKQTNAATNILTLPSGYRPALSEVWTSGYGNSYVSVTVSNAGVLTVGSIGGGSITGLIVSLSGMSFDPA